jgi:two-component system, NarL family, sensor histidine kinase DesK
MRLNSSMPSTGKAEPEDGPRQARRIWLAILGVLLTVQISAILAVAVPANKLTVSLAAVTALALLQGRHLGEMASTPAWLRLGVLTAEGLVTYLPLLMAGVAWPGMGGFLAASALLAVRGGTGWALFTAVIVSMFAATMAMGLGIRGADFATVASLAVGLTISGVYRLSTLVRQMHGGRAEVAQLAVVRERLRFARDLHDLLGHSLTAITLRTELTRRLMSSDPATASDELQDVVNMARQAVAEVRQVADGYRNISLAQEVAAAASLLASANVAARVEMNCGILPDKVDAVLATVLRELITNTLRHSSARNCWITVEQAGEGVTLSVANDGVPRAAATHRDRGGLENLAVRLEAVGGTLSATVRGGGRFCVLAQISPQADAAVGARDTR